MATRINMMKLLHEIRGFAVMNHRRPQPRSPGLVLIPLRSRLLQGPGLRPKRVIPIKMQIRPDIPAPVRIVHLPSRPCE